MPAKVRHALQACAQAARCPLGHIFCRARGSLCARRRRRPEGRTPDCAAAARAQAGKALDLPVYFGDAGSPAVLHSLGAHRAACAVITLDTPGANYRSVWALHKHFPHVKSYVRAHDVMHGLNLEKARAAPRLLGVQGLERVQAAGLAAAAPLLLPAAVEARDPPDLQQPVPCARRASAEAGPLAPDVWGARRAVCGARARRRARRRWCPRRWSRACSWRARC